MKTAAQGIVVSVSCADWEIEVPDAAAVVSRAAAAALDQKASNAPNCPGEISVMLGDDATLRDLNRRHRGIDKATNVLAFPLTDDAGPMPPGPMLLGDVAVALGVCRREAAESGKTTRDHLSHLIVHGVLHLLGEDHQHDADAARMEGMEIAALKKLNIANPYA